MQDKNIKEKKKKNEASQKVKSPRSQWTSESKTHSTGNLSVQLELSAAAAAAGGGAAGWVLEKSPHFSCYVNIPRVSTKTRIPSKCLSINLCNL